MKFSRKKGRKDWLLWLFIILCIVLLIIVAKLFITNWELDFSGFLQAIIEGISIIVALLILRRELESGQAQEEAEFIVSLNQSFVENPDCKKVFTYCIHERRLIRYYEGKEELDEDAVHRLKKELENDDNKPSQAEVSNYLTFYESLFILLEGKAISWEVINELFKYRFFVVVHSKFIQDKRLVRLSTNFKNIYYLEYLWMKFNDFDKTKVAGWESILKKSLEKYESADHGREKIRYEDIISDMEAKKHMIVEMNKTHPYNIVEKFGNYIEV